jgi:hypothetical protein
MTITHEQFLERLRSRDALATYRFVNGVAVHQGRVGTAANLTTSADRQVPPPELPPFYVQAANFAAAQTKHIAAGRPWCTPEQIAERVSICESCELFRADIRKCSVCGCGCGADVTFMNKLAMATEQCPHPDGAKWTTVSPPAVVVPPFTAPLTRHLAYHVYPRKWHPWLWNVEQLLKRMPLFNGRRIIAIVTDSDTETAETVMQQFAGWECEFILQPNNRVTGEAATFEQTLAQLESTNPNEVIFRAHAKQGTHGNKKAREPWDGSIVQRWTQAMYEALLDDWPAVEAQLAEKAFTGAFRKHGKLGRTTAKWFYSGSFWWARSAAVFARDWRSAITKNFLTAEAFPGQLVSLEESDCVLADDCGNLYSAEYWKALERGAP